MGIVGAYETKFWYSFIKSDDTCIRSDKDSEYQWLAKTSQWIIHSSCEFFKDYRFFVETSKWIFCAFTELIKNYNRRTFKAFKCSIDFTTKFFAQCSRFSTKTSKCSFYQRNFSG